jgi:membrane protein
MGTYKSYRGINELPKPMETPVKPTDKQLVRYLKTHTMAGFKQHSIYDVGKYFLNSLFRENLNLRASSLSFNFFLSLFPILIFLLTLIGYLPVKGLKSGLIQEIELLLPDASSKALSETIYELLNQQNSSLLSAGFLMALYFASNAFHTMINTFNRRLPQRRRRNWVQNRLMAIGLTFLITFYAIVTLFLVAELTKFSGYIHEHDWPVEGLFKFIISLLEYLFIAGLVLMTISSVYHFSPATKNRWTFISAGSIFAWVLSMISTFAFSLYVNNFNSYNKVYGSIGAIIALMILIYINTLVILVGFDLNTSIEKASITADKRKKKAYLSENKLKTD